MNKKKETTKKQFLIVFRYLVLLIISLNFNLIYKILAPITVYLSGLLLDLFYTITIIGDKILIQGKIIEINSACVAGSAYLLLLILNLFVSMNKKQRFYSLLFSFFLLLIFNILRIFFLSILFVNDFLFFNLTHKIFWYFLSTIFVVIIWVLMIKIFSIKQIPVYSDIKFMLKSIKK